MKSKIILGCAMIVLLTSLSGCVVVPARPYYAPPPPVAYYHPAYYYR